MDTKFLGRRHSWILKTVQGQTAPFAGARAQLLNIIDASTGAQSSLINATISDGCHTIIALFNRDTVLKAVPSDSPSPQWSSVAPRLKNAYITLTQYSVLPSRRLRTFNCVVVQFRYVSFGFPPLDPPLDIGQERYVREHFASPQSLAASGSSSSSAAAASDSAEEASLSPQLPDDQEVLDILAEMLSTPPVSSASASSPSPPTPSSKRSRHDRDDDDENSNNNDDDDDDEIIDDDSDNDNDSEQLVEADFIVSSSQEVLLEDLSLVDGVTSWQLASQMDDCSRIMSMSPFCELPRPSQLSPFRQSASQRITSWPDIEPSEAEDRLLFSLSAPADRPASPPSRFRVDIEPVVVDSRVDRRSVDEEDNSAVGRTSVSTSLNDDNDDDDNYNDDDNDDEDDDDDDDDDDDNEKGQQLHGERTKTHGGATETQRTDSKQEAVKRRTRRRRNKKNRPTKRQRLAARLLAVSHSLVSTPPRPSNHAEDTFSPPQQTPTRRLRAASLHPSPPLHIGFPTPDLYVPKTAPSRRRPTEPSPSSPPSSRSQSPPPFQVALPSSCSSSSESPHSPPMMRSSSTHQRRPAGIVVNPTGREVAIDYQSWL